MIKPYYETPNGKLYHGACEDVLPEVKDKIDLCLADPPYGIGINKSNRLSVSRGFGNETWDSKPVSRKVLNLIIKMSKNQIIWGGNYFNLSPTKCFLIWDKKNDGRDFADCEFAWTSFDSVARMFRKRPQNMDGGKVHPTQKPIYLFLWIIDNYSKSNDLICDPFAGSGTTGIACERLNRKYILIEKELEYVEIAKQRITREIQQTKMF